MPWSVRCAKELVSHTEAGAPIRRVAGQEVPCAGVAA
jgi:hypothetical protein